MSKAEKEKEEPQDKRLLWMEQRYNQALKMKPLDAKKFLENEENRQSLLEFLDVAERQNVFIAGTAAGQFVVVSGEYDPQQNRIDFRKKVFYFTKSKRMKIVSIEDPAAAAIVFFGDVHVDMLQFVHQFTENFLLPLIQVKQNVAAVPAVCFAELMESTHKVLAESLVTMGKGRHRTLLPLPPIQLPRSINAADALVQNKELIHELETVVMGWMASSRETVELRPEGLKAFLKRWPGPLDELEFWEEKLSNLAGLEAQFSRVFCCKVLTLLKFSGSSYHALMCGAISDVRAAREEASDCCSHLRPMRDIFELVNVGSSNHLPFEKLVSEGVFPRIFRVLYDVWCHSKHFTAPAKMVNLIFEITTDLIASAMESVDAATLFTAERQEVTKSIVGILNTCGQFKAAFFLFKGKSAKELQRPWRFQNAALFRQLDAFLERLHDVLDILETTMLFEKAANIRLGGSDSINLCVEVDHVQSIFNGELLKLQESPVNYLDVDDARFDAVYSQFRRVIQSLEERLSKIMTSGLEDTVGLPMIFKVVDSFDGFTDRPTVHQEWASKQVAVLKSWKKELQTLCDHFTQHKDRPISFLPNIPPTASSVIWGTALLDRLDVSFGRVSELANTVLLSQLGVDTFALHAKIKQEIKQYIHVAHEIWTSTVGEISNEKLHCYLLAKNPTTGEYIVNFDKQLVAVLKEVLYIDSFQQQHEDDAAHSTPIPQQVGAIHKSREQLRHQVLKLDYVCTTVNHMIAMLQPAERAIIQEELDAIIMMLYRGMTSLVWATTETVDDYILSVVKDVAALDDVFKLMRLNINDVKQAFQDFSAEDKFLPQYASKGDSKVMTEGEYKKKLGEYNTARIAKLESHHQRLNGDLLANALQHINTLKELHRLPPIDAQSTVWKEYLSFLLGEYSEMLVAVVGNSLTALQQQLDENWLIEHHALPLLDIKLTLHKSKNDGASVAFDPPLASTGSSPSVQQIVEQTISAIFSLTESFFIEGINSRGVIRSYIEAHPSVHAILKIINKNVAENEVKCTKFTAQFIAYSDLFNENIQYKFKDFIQHESQLIVDAATAEAKRIQETSITPTIEVAPVVPFHFFNGVPMHRYGAMIRKYEMLLDDLEDLPTASVTGFVKIDAKLIRTALNELCCKWRDAYSGSLTQRVTSELEDLYSFAAAAEKELDQEVAEGDFEGLKTIMRWIRDCRQRNDLVGKMLLPVSEAVVMLKSHPSALTAAQLERLENLRKPAAEVWAALYRKCMNTREQYSHQQDREAERLKEDTLTFEVRVAECGREMRMSDLFGYEMDRNLAYRHIDSWSTRFKQLEIEARVVSEMEALFELAVTEFKELKDSRGELVMVKHVWDFVNHVCVMFDDRMSSTFAEVDVEDFLEEVKRLQKQLKSQPMKAKEWPVYKGLDEKVTNMGKSLPLCAELRTPAMRDRHWDTLLRAANQIGKVDPRAVDFTLERLVGLGLHKHAEDVYTIVEKAQKELIIERNLLKLIGIWEKMTFTYERNEALNVTLLCSVDAVVEQLETDTNSLQSMLSDRFVEFFLSKVQLWQKHIGTIDTCMTKWIDIQRKWVNLFPIFVLSADIREQLPEDSKRFIVADDMYRALMYVAPRYQNVIEVLCTDALVKAIGTWDGDLEAYLQKMEDILARCEKSLTEYLETKRKMFPRFFFVSSADLVDILSKGSDPKAVMVHMSKIVDSIETFLIDDNPHGPPHEKKVWELVSIQGEHVRLAEDFICDGPVEVWLDGCISMMQKTMRMHIAEANAGYIDKPRTEWIYQYPCQAVIVASRSWYTAETQQAFQMMEDGSDTAMKDFLKLQRNQLDVLIKEVLLDRKSNDRKMLVHLITIDVHNRDIIQSLVDERTDSAEAFAWQSQLRYYWDDKKGSEIRICDADFQNGYEYVGLCGCLVITKLTDRCYTTLSQALRLKRGGAPAGPAGTGKTETTKDLARNLGIACYVFNCSDQMNYITLGQIFKGLAMSGSWGCFDEFNRISIEVLSVVATQVGSILNALKSSKKRFRFMDEEIGIIHRVGMFITMNPGYAGRTELPENIKSLFRPCAMCVPDLKNICEIMLAAEGFIEAKDLSLKFVTLYRLNRELLSPQDHYDWGLRAVKSVLYIAGSLRRGDPDVPERKVLMRALRDTNLAKLSKDDVYVFMGLIKSLFPQLEAPKKDKPELSEALKAACQQQANFPGENDIFILKCLQYEEILHVRHSVFILGPAGCGKTQCYKCLQLALTKLGNKCATIALNPKAVTSNELYGYIHPQTKEWRDGILSNIFRQFALESKTKKNSKWIVLDGIVDAEWIESMNTVMDDNKMLTLVSNERIPLTESMRMIFEVSQLRNASPATVSRGGVVFINESDLGWGPFKDKWIASRDPKEGASLDVLFEKFVPVTFEYFRRVSKPIVGVMDIAIVQTVCNLLEGLLANIKEKTPEAYERYFVFAVVWAFGGPLPSDGRIDYRLQFSNWWRKENPTQRIGEGGTVFDFFIDVTDNYEFKPWSTLVSPYRPDPDMPLGNVSVQTADTVRMRELMSLLIDNGKPVVLVGTAGTGKSNLIMAKLRTLNNEHTIFRVIAFNARTGSAGLQSVMEQSLEKRSGRQFGPIGRKKLIFFLDDVNMPNPDKYGTQDAIAFLQQHMNYGYWYDRQKISQKEVVDLRYAAAMNPKSGTFTILDRVLRHFAVFSANMPDREDLTRIYGQILLAHMTTLGRDMLSIAEPITAATIDLHAKVTKEFLPTAVLFFYQWNMRELFNIFQGLCKSTKKLHTDPSSIVRLWAHECHRTFQDRMPREEDIKKFDEFMAQVKQSYFPEMNSSGALVPLGVWAPYRVTKDGEENVYDECDSTFVNSFLLSKLADYNSNFAQMDLVLFTEASEHVCRVARVTSNPRGNALLVGVGGSGKQSLARLASAINGHEIFQIQVTSTYGISNFRTDVQELYKKCGLKGLLYALIITDQQLVSMDMLVYLNDMLNSGNVPDLFIGDERDAVIGSIAGEVKQMGIVVTPDSCWSYFVDKVRTNLHVVLCMSPVGKTFAQWCRQFPALANTTVIDWFHPWPQRALQSVAQRFLSTVELGSDATKQQIAEFMADCQQEVTTVSERYFAIEKRRCFTTPKSFLELIQMYKDLLQRKRDELSLKTERLVVGIDKIRDASEQVAQLQAVLVKESIEVAEASEKTGKLMEHVGREKSTVEEQSAIAGIEESKTNKIVVEVEAFAADCQADLAAAKPLVEEAMAALNTLDKASLTELKSMARPPDDVVMVCLAVKILTSPPTKIPPTKSRDWAACKAMMTNIGQWLNSLLAFDQDNIPQPCIDALQLYVTNPSFDPTSVISKSFAAAGLCKWVLGMNAYHKVRCEVRPKEEKLVEAQERLASSKQALKKVQDKVSDLKGKLDTLMKQYDSAVETSGKIEARAHKTKSKMALAERLVGGLADEKVRWGKSIDALKQRADLLVGDVLLASAFVSYIGPFTRRFRDQIVNEMWVPNLKNRGIAMTNGLDIVMDILTTEAAVASWNNDGLPNDPVSTQNGAIIMNCSRWPLMIDPQLQGVRWIRTKEEKNGLVVVQPGQKFFIDKITKCVEEGLPCLIESCSESIDPVLDNVLGRVTFRRGNKLLMRIGASDVEFNKKFKLFLQTRLSNPHYKPEVNAQTTIINFMVTESGLEDQLLAVVVNQERQDLEQKRVTLLRMMNTMTIELQQCEDGLLFELSNATGDILENIALIENLEATKKKANEINRSMIEAVSTQANIAKLRLKYQLVAERGSLLFFQIDQLCKIDHMYQYSLEAFMVVFNKALAKAEQPEDLNNIELRVVNVIRSITESVFAYVARGLFERHKLIFSSLLTFAILSKKQEIDKKQLDFLLMGRKKVGASDRPESVREWCPESNWAAAVALSEEDPMFAALTQDMSDSNRWKVWCDAEKAEDEKMPADWKGLTNFQRLLILRCLRPDRLTSALEAFVAHASGKFFISDQAVDISVSFKDGATTTPLFFILSPGVDPVKSVEQLGQKLGFTYDNEKLYNVSLGQGQEEVAERALKKCFTSGGWCLLNNVHLVERWLRELEKTLDIHSEVYIKMAQVARRKAERRNGRRMIWLAEQEVEREAKAKEEQADEPAAAGEPSGTDVESSVTVAPAEAVAVEEPNFDSDVEDPEEANIVKGALDFRIFLSAEPSTSIPIGILQRSVKLTSEPPSGVSQNIKRALSNFVDEPWEKSSKPSEFRAVMFAMCFFHSVVVERKKFGPQGWNRVYPFNVGDLTTCLDVLGNYIEDRPKIPWEDLRYVFGEIMYGGHITDDWDRVLCMAYLEQWIVTEVIDGVDLAPGFPVPPPSTYKEYEQYVDEVCPAESPVLFGLHPNAEINFRTAQAENLFRIISDLQPKQASADKGDMSTDIVRDKVNEVLERLPETFALIDIGERLDEDRTPPQHVFYQECERMNLLIETMKRSLLELSLGLKGELSMTAVMQTLFDEILVDRVPDVWARNSFASLRPLGSWFENMNQRYGQLTEWTGELQTPKVTMLSYFFNPMSLLTAIMQHTSMANNYDLDQMALIADVTKKMPEQVDVAARDACHVYGLVMEGARWDTSTGCIDDSRMKELYPRMPVITIKSLPLSKVDRRDQYECPLYKTQARGPTFVVGLWLRTKQPARKWVIAGVGCLLDIVE